MFRRFCVAATLLFARTICPAQDPAPPSPEVKAAAERYNRLGISLFGAVGQTRPGNFVISSWPMHRSLSLALLGAAGETRTQIAKAVGSDDPVGDEKALLSAIDPGIAQWNQLAMVAKADGQRADQVEWATLSAVWVDPRVKLQPAFTTAVQKMHGTLVRAVDFKNSGKTIADVNQWVAEMTKNRIARLLPPNAFNKDTRLALSSATFLKAPWSYQFQFKRANSRFEPFRVNGNTPERVPTMIQRASFGSAVHKDFTALTLPAAGDFQLLLLVPNEATKIAGLQERVTPELLQDCALMKKSRIELHLPKFRIDSTTLAVRPLLQAMGMRLAFEDEKADFTALASSPPLKLSEIFDAAEFQIDENGVSGAGATVVAAAVFAGDESALPAESTFRIDRPFLFALQHASTGYCVFLGKVMDPR